MATHSDRASGAADEGAEERAPLQPQWRPRALYDIESAVAYLGQVLENSLAAKALYERVRDQVDLLCRFPDMGKPFADALLEGRGYRTFLVDQYRLFYTHDDKTLTTWRLVHTRRDIDDYALVGLSD